MATIATKARRRPRPVWEFGKPKVLDIPPDALTYSGFINWVMGDEFPEKVRATFFAGRVRLDMSEESLETHIAVRAAMYMTMNAIIVGEDLGEFYPEGIFVCNDAAEVASNPDGAAVLWETLDAGRVRYVVRKGISHAIEGSPDWILEIVSPSSVKKDTKTLREAYHRAKIPEYWLIDARGDEIQFHILLWRRNGYVAAPSKDGWVMSEVFGRSFRLSRKRNRRGGWTYLLETKPADNKSKARQ